MQDCELYSLHIRLMSDLLMGGHPVCLHYCGCHRELLCSNFKILRKRSTWVKKILLIIIIIIQNAIFPYLDSEAEIISKIFVFETSLLWLVFQGGQRWNGQSERTELHRSE